jgi:hypothetical protein
MFWSLQVRKTEFKYYELSFICALQETHVERFNRKLLIPGLTIDYICADKLKVGKLRGIIGAI